MYEVLNIFCPTEAIFASVPKTTRGRPTVLKADPTGKKLLYSNGTSIFIRNLEVSITPLEFLSLNIIDHIASSTSLMRTMFRKQLLWDWYCALQEGTCQLWSSKIWGKFWFLVKEYEKWSDTNFPTQHFPSLMLCLFPLILPLPLTNLLHCHSKLLSLPTWMCHWLRLQPKYLAHLGNIQ